MGGDVLKNQHYFIGIQVPGREASLFNQLKNSMELDQTHKISVAPEDMHITLLFLGGMEKSLLAKLIKQLEQIAPLNKSFKVTSSSVQVFGKPTQPRVVYANIEDNHLLNQLQKELSNCVDSIGIRQDEKSFIPHITLAKKWRNTEEMRPLLPFNTAITFDVSHFYLYEIHPTKSPKYKPIAYFQLGDT